MNSNFSYQKSAIRYLVIIVVSALSGLTIACNNQSQIPHTWRTYQGQLDTFLDSLEKQKKSAPNPKQSYKKKGNQSLHDDRLVSMIDHRFKDFHQQIKTLSPATQYELPSLRDRKLETAPRLQININEFLRLQGCELSYLIGLRNSQLGRVMTHSQRLIYQARFIHTAPHCEMNHGHLKLEDTLKKVWYTKVKHWSHYVWNATWLTREFSLFFSKSWPRNNPPSSLNASHESRLLWLTKIAQWSNKVSYKEPQASIKLKQLHMLNRTQVHHLRNQLESTLKSLPPYVGGKILWDASLNQRFFRNILLQSQLWQINRRKLH